MFIVWLLLCSKAWKCTVLRDYLHWNCELWRCAFRFHSSFLTISFSSRFFSFALMLALNKHGVNAWNLFGWVGSLRLVHLCIFRINSHTRTTQTTSKQARAEQMANFMAGDGKCIFIRINLHIRLFSSCHKCEQGNLLARHCAPSSSDASLLFSHIYRFCSWLKPDYQFSLQFYAISYHSSIQFAKQTQRLSLSFVSCLPFNAVDILGNWFKLWRA